MASRLAITARIQRSPCGPARRVRAPAGMRAGEPLLVDGAESRSMSGPRRRTELSERRGASRTFAGRRGLRLETPGRATLRRAIRRARRACADAARRRSGDRPARSAMKPFEVEPTRRGAGARLAWPGQVDHQLDPDRRRQPRMSMNPGRDKQSAPRRRRHEPRHIGGRHNQRRSDSGSGRCRLSAAAFRWGATGLPRASAGRASR